MALEWLLRSVRQDEFVDLSGEDLAAALHAVANGVSASGPEAHVRTLAQLAGGVIEAFLPQDPGRSAASGKPDRA